MKKFKRGDVIRLKADDDKRRTYEVLVGTDDSRLPPTAIRNDNGVALAASFALGRPEDYELVKRPSKKDREIKRLMDLVESESKRASIAEVKATEAQDAADAQLLEAGLVRIDLLRENVIDGNWSGDPNGVRLELVIDVRKDAVRAAARRIAR